LIFFSQILADIYANDADISYRCSFICVNRLVIGADLREKDIGEIY
jgi:hypothetical protein